MSPGDEVLFGGRKYTLLEQTFAGPNAMWLAVETDNVNAKPRLLVEGDLREVPDAARRERGTDVSALSEGRLEEIEAFVARCCASVGHICDGYCDSIRDLLADAATVRAQMDEMFTAQVVDECVASETAKLRAQLAAAHAALRESQQECERLSGIVIHHQAEQKRLEVANDRLKLEYAERGRVNADLNKRLQRALSTPEGL